MQHWAQSFAKRGLFLDVHFHVQHFGFSSACFLGMGVQTGKWRLHELWTSLYAICHSGISGVYSSAEDGANWNRPETPTLRTHRTFWRDWDGLRFNRERSVGVDQYRRLHQFQRPHTHAASTDVWFGTRKPYSCKNHGYATLIECC